MGLGLGLGIGLGLGLGVGVGVGVGDLGCRRSSYWRALLPVLFDPLGWAPGASWGVSLLGFQLSGREARALKEPRERVHLWVLDYQRRIASRTLMWWR